MTTKADKLRDELITLRATQNAEGYSYDVAVEGRIKAVVKELATLYKRRAQAQAHRSLMYDINGHYGRA